MINHDSWKKTILLVDDDAIIAQAIAENLEREGYHVTLAQSGEEALRVMEQRRGIIDLVIMDIDLGDDMDGTEAAREILKSHDIPLVFLSSYTDRDIIEKTEKISSYGYVAKNSGRTVLAASIRMAFRLHEANRLLRATGDNFSTVFHSNPDPMSISRMGDGLILDVNKAFTDITGYGRDEVVGRNSLGDLNFWLHPEDRARILAELEKMGRIEGLEIPLLVKDGSVKICQMSASIITYNGMECVIIVGRDLTERRKIEKALQDSEEQYRNIVESSLVGVYIIQDDRYVFINKTYYETSGYTCDEMMNSIRPSDLIHPEDRGYVGRYIEQRLKGEKEPREYEFRGVKKDGSVIHLKVLGGPMMYRGRPALIGTAIDITEQKHVDEALRVSEARYRAFFEYSIDAVLIASLEGAIEAANREACRIFNMTEEEIVSHGRDAVIDPSDPRVKPALRELLATGGYKGELRFRRKGGEVFPAEVSMGCYTDMNGFKKVTTLIRDITFRKNFEKDLHDLIQDKTALLKEIHHRVKNNMQIVTSLLGLRVQDLKDTEAHGALTDIMQQIFSIARVHENIYRSDNISSIDFRDYLNDLVYEIIQTYKPDPEKIAVTIDVRDVRLTLDKAVPCGILVNEILTNAIKHGCSGTEPGAIRLSFLPGENHYILEVRDDGPGIPDSVLIEKQKRMGMMLIHALCGQLNADISIERNIGTCYHITIPA